MVNPSNKRLIFVGGVHGVGKTTFCQKIANSSGVQHFSASELIKRILKSDYAKNKHTQNISANQDILIDSIAQFVPCGSYCLLDGHFCLLDHSGAVTEVPLVTFEQMSPVAIIVLEDTPNNIAERIRDRDGESPQVDVIIEFQNHELRYSKEIGLRLCIPYLSVSPITGVETAKKFLKSIE
jgi:adenylate kinase